MRTISLTLGIINGFKLDEFCNVVEIQSDRYNFTHVEGSPPSQNEIIGNREAILTVLKSVVERLEDTNYEEKKFENWTYGQREEIY